MSFILPAFIALLSIIVPGFLLALALLGKTKLNKLEIGVMGFTFGLIFPPAMIWLESYLIGYLPQFAFSVGLYNINVIILSIIGLALCFWQGFLSVEYLKPFVGMKAAPKHEHAQHLPTEVAVHENPEEIAKKGQHSKLIWYLLVILMVVAFVTRILSLPSAAHFFEFDPYFDLLSTSSILVHGYQVLYDHSAWPVLVAGSPHRIEPIIPYLEAYWYGLSTTNLSQLDTTLLSNTSSFYPPLVAALLVFIVFMFVYHEYGEFPAIIAAILTTAMPALITTFIAGEQLLEPIGILTLFFFYAAYLLAVNNMKEKRFAILAGIAFVSTFLGAHYYTVDAGVLAIYILLQGVIFVQGNKAATYGVVGGILGLVIVSLFAGITIFSILGFALGQIIFTYLALRIRSSLVDWKIEDTKDFYKMNAIIILIIAVFYEVFAPYGSVLTNRTPEILHVPIIFGFALFALVFVAIFEFVPKLLHKYKVLKSAPNAMTYLYWFAILSLVGVILVTFTSLGAPVQKYITLSAHFTTPSIPLFATVQEYAPTGFNFNFGSAGFGPIGASIFGVNIIIWLVLIAFFVLMLLAIYYRNSRFSILSFAAILPLALAGMIEVKYLPHFGVGYIIAIGAIIGELLLLINSKYNFNEIKNSIPKLDLKSSGVRIIVAVTVLAAILESTVFVSIASAAANPNCNSLATAGNGMGYTLYCQTISQGWLDATAWMKANVGPYAPRILAWWDYGDWINWFGNSNAVLRGDNAVATEDYATAAQYVLSKVDGVTTGTLSTFMNSIQSKYVLFDSELMQKWGALDFLGCVSAGQTSLAYAVQQGQAHGQSYPSLGGSQCELNHGPVYALIPTASNNINNYCQFPNSSMQALKVLMLAGSSFLNATYCVPTTLFNSVAPVHLYSQNGTQTNAVIIPQTTFYYGTIQVSGQSFADFFVVYLPNGPNNTITNAPTLFYNSSYYKGFFFGKLPGFRLVYPQNFNGMNYFNSSNPVMVYQLNNYTGGLPPVTPKASYVQNNYTMPG